MTEGIPTEGHLLPLVEFIAVELIYRRIKPFSFSNGSLAFPNCGRVRDAVFNQGRTLEITDFRFAISVSLNLVLRLIARRRVDPALLRCNLGRQVGFGLVDRAIDCAAGFDLPGAEPRKGAVQRLLGTLHGRNGLGRNHRPLLLKGKHHSNFMIMFISESFKPSRRVSQLV